MLTNFDHGSVNKASYIDIQQMIEISNDFTNIKEVKLLKNYIQN